MRAIVSLLILSASIIFCAPIVSLAQDSGTSKSELHNLRDVQNALAACFRSLPVFKLYPNIRLTIRLSFNGHGDLQGSPRFTYVTPNAPDRIREEYKRVILQALRRCTPLNFSQNLGAAIAGIPFIFRFNETSAIKV